MVETVYDIVHVKVIFVALGIAEQCVYPAFNRPNLTYQEINDSDKYNGVC